LRPLLAWVMSSNRAHLRKLERSEHTDLVQSEHQFVLASSSPEKEARFRLLKSQVQRENKGKTEAPASIHAWHGSALSNWHAILRSGLKNFSNTKFMTAGSRLFYFFLFCFFLKMCLNLTHKVDVRLK
jgi:hypothetical protein